MCRPVQLRSFKSFKMAKRKNKSFKMLTHCKFCSLALRCQIRVKHGEILMIALQRLRAKDLQMLKTTQPIFLLQSPEYIAWVISFEITLTESILIRLHLICIPEVDCLDYVGENTSKWNPNKWISCCQFRNDATLMTLLYANLNICTIANLSILQIIYSYKIETVSMKCWLCEYCSICKRLHAH